MADTFDPKTRSWIMSRVMSRHTKPEKKVIEALKQAGMRFSTHCAKVVGNPDVVFTRKRIAVFVNGCFWHWHGCSRSRMPSTNVTYWKNKIQGNTERDRGHRSELHRRGWRYVTIWECDLERGIRRCIRAVQGIRK